MSTTRTYHHLSAEKRAVIMIKRQYAQHRPMSWALAGDHQP